MAGPSMNTPHRNVAHMYRGKCTPLVGVQDDTTDADQDTHHAIFAILLPFLGVAVVLAGIVFLMTQTTNAASYVPPVIRTVMLVVAAVAFVGALFLWRRVWYVDDMPTIEVAAAHPGAGEFVGRARTGAPATGWFSGLPVVHWSGEIYETRRDKDGRSERVKIWSESGGHSKFWLDDGTGMVQVNSRGAAGGSMRRTVDRKLGNYHIIEHALLVDQQLFVTGPVQFEDDGMLCVRRPRNKIEAGQRAPFWIALTEARLRSSMRGGAMLTTAISLLLAAASSMWVVVPSTAQDRLDQSTLMLRESSLLLPFAVIFAGVLTIHLAHYFIRLFNRLVELKNQASFAFATIDVAAARRHDLITKLVDVAAAASDHERKAIEQAIRSRNQLPDEKRVDSVTQSISGDNHKRSLISVVEAHPDIVAAEAYNVLFDNLIDSENRIAASRRFYNDAVTLLRDRAGAFPGVLVAPLVVGSSIPPLLSIDLGSGEATAGGEVIKPSGTDLGQVDIDDLVVFQPKNENFADYEGGVDLGPAAGL